MIPLIDSNHYLESMIATALAIALFFIITGVIYYFFGIVGAVVMICIGMAALICCVIYLVHETHRIDQESKDE